MTLEEIYYIGQSIAVLAILASLVAIFFQLRQGQQMERSAAQRALTDQARQWSRSTSVDPELFDIVARLLEDYDSASPTERNIFSNWGMDYLFLIGQAVYLRQDGFMHETAYYVFLRAMLSIIVTPGGAQWWERTGQRAVSAVIRAHIEEGFVKLAGDIPRFDELRPELKDHREALKAGA